MNARVKRSLIVDSLEEGGAVEPEEGSEELALLLLLELRDLVRGDLGTLVVRLPLALLLLPPPRVLVRGRLPLGKGVASSNSTKVGSTVLLDMVK